jgi:hypothetical protein
VNVKFVDATAEQARALFIHFFDKGVEEETCVQVKNRLDDLADCFCLNLFSDAIKKEISMASIQAFLLLHRDDAEEAVRLARAWRDGTGKIEGVEW